MKYFSDSLLTSPFTNIKLIILFLFIISLLSQMSTLQMIFLETSNYFGAIQFVEKQFFKEINYLLWFGSDGDLSFRKIITRKLLNTFIKIQQLKEFWTIQLYEKVVSFKSKINVHNTRIGIFGLFWWYWTTFEFQKENFLSKEKKKYETSKPLIQD